ncbi:UEV-domain-containing protein [Pseudovirgaria hyperparasitica]|uniref:UEV-domain-containing protein n=1 Tax=Pseudovirgaria hyperparasitica TaxID=470096 RepID=A0A6A6W937_9PEZI|nr:UEV-domain-containing protein [Pseudovirgaria hyperparasitica]KAF2759065.1 UEV-domain-containing protein [Pseudovirgaria hyperparasitica]
MSALPDSVLNWLYGQLSTSYLDANRTYSDIVESLSNYRSLRPRTEVYTYENGQSALFINISGTIPVQFRGVVYRFPVTIWVPYAYPREAPMVYVTPSQDMVVTPGQHVSGDGRVYHPYLAQWGQYWDKSSLSDFISVLRGVFAKEPPVRTKQHPQFTSPQTTQPSPQPPPVPPPPEELRRANHHTPTPANTTPSNGAPQPPPKPPKPYSSTGSPIPGSAPPPPPKPPHSSQQDYTQVQQRHSWQQAHDLQAPQQSQSQHPPQRQSSLSQPPRPQIQPQYNRQGQFSSPVSPITPISAPRGPVPQFQQQQPQPYQPQVHSGLRQSQQTLHDTALPQPHPHYHPSGHLQHQSYPSQPQPHSQSQPSKPKQPIPDLLDAPLDVTLPSQDPSHAHLPAPPIPPNPEKDALLRTLSTALTSRISTTINANTAAIPALRSQQTALGQAHNQLQSELHELQQLDATLAANEQIIREAMLTADRVMDEAKRRKVPDVDEVLVAPTVVGGQLYTLCAEERAVGDALFVLGRGLDRGRVGADIFVKQTRSLAREQFLKKALIKKIARGMGLEVYDYGR